MVENTAVRTHQNRRHVHCPPTRRQKIKGHQSSRAPPVAYGCRQNPGSASATHPVKSAARSSRLAKVGPGFRALAEIAVFLIKAPTLFACNFTMTSTPTLHPQTCPLCDQPNQCAMEVERATGIGQPPCWCTQTQFSAELLNKIPEAARGVACLCTSCVTAIAP